MKKRLMLPAMAFVFAIGLSFATERSTADAQNDWADMGTHLQKIEEVNCGIPADDCEGRFAGDDTWYVIYDSVTSEDPKQGAGQLDENDYLIPVLN